MSGDPDLGLVYLPVTAPTSDMYGGHRLGDNLFSQSVVAVEAATGKRVWHFQMVRHDLWTSIRPRRRSSWTQGRRARIKALVQITKQGYVYTLDRATGKPVWPIVERRMPASNTPGERTAPTQRYDETTRVRNAGLRRGNLIDFTPELHAEALEIVKRYTTGRCSRRRRCATTGPTASSAHPAAGSIGGANWTGGAVDPDTGILYVPRRRRRWSRTWRLEIRP